MRKFILAFNQLSPQNLLLQIKVHKNLQVLFQFILLLLLNNPLDLTVLGDFTPKLLLLLQRIRDRLVIQCLLSLLKLLGLLSFDLKPLIFKILQMRLIQLFCFVQRYLHVHWSLGSFLLCQVTIYKVFVELDRLEFRIVF